MSAPVDIRQLAVDRGGTRGPSPRRWRPRLSRYLIPAMLIAGYLALVGWASRDLLLPPKPVTVVPVVSVAGQVQYEGTPLFRAAGWVEPRPTPLRVPAMAPGVVKELRVVENQAVSAGEPIAELVSEDARSARDRAAAELKLRQAQLQRAHAVLAAAETRLQQPVHLDAILADAEAALAKIETEMAKVAYEVRQAEAELETAQKEYDAKISAEGVVAGIQIEMAKGKVATAKARWQELRDRPQSLAREVAAWRQRRDALAAQRQLLAEERRERDVAQAEVEAVSAQVEQARVALAEADLRLQRMTIHAPVDGRIFRLIAHPGAYVGGGMGHRTDHDGSTVVTMYRPDMLQVRVDVRFEDIPRVSLEQPVEMRNPAWSAPVTGQVLFISSEADIQKNTLQVKVQVPDPPAVFKPEMLVDVTFLAPPQPEDTEPSPQWRLYAPSQLVHQGANGSYVWLADQAHGRARKVGVETGAAGHQGLVEITRGLKIGSRLIVGGEDLREGGRIRVTGEDATLGTLDAVRQASGQFETNRQPTEEEHHGATGDQERHQAIPEG